VAVLSPAYIERHFGRFGKETVKEQLIVTASKRAKIVGSKPPLIFYPDDVTVRPMLADRPIKVRDTSITAPPVTGRVVPLERIRDIVTMNILGKRIPTGATKNRGQALELRVATLLGYNLQDSAVLAGGFPDIPNQALEVKVQDAPTVDLGRYSPQFEEKVPSVPGFTSTTVRYIVALTNPASELVEGLVIAPGWRLGEHFSFVADQSFKSQRSIPMDFFCGHDGNVVYDP
jgi:hypothetical protein